jgi:hypothetical protein
MSRRPSRATSRLSAVASKGGQKMSDKGRARLRAIGRFVLYTAVVIYLLMLYDKISSIESDVSSIQSDVSTIESNMPSR